MDEREERLVRAIAVLRELPEVRAESTARVLIAVAAERQRQRELGGMRSWRRRAWLVAGGIAAAGIVIAAASSMSSRVHDDAVVAVRERRPTPLTPIVAAAASADLVSAPRPVQLVFDAPAARSVRVVGDFNGWDERSSPMVRDEASGLWNVNLMVRPGRHVYAFVVNDTQWVRDPRAAAAPDADFGRAGSVLLVGRP